MKKHNRILAFALALTMLISIAPVPVFPVTAVDQETDQVFTYDFSEESDLFVPKVSAETTPWTIGPAPDNATTSNQVMVSAGGGQNVVYGPATWPGKEGWHLKKLSFRFNIHGLETNLSSGGQRIVIWQNPQDPTDYIAIDWRREGTTSQGITKMFNASVTVCKDGATSNQWCVGSLQITDYAGDYGEDSWCTFTAEYQNDMDVNLTVTPDVGNAKSCTLTGISAYWTNGSTKTGVETQLGITDFDYRTGYIGFTPPTSGQTMYYDDVVLTFDGPSVAATQFKTDHAVILAMAPATFETNYATAKELLVGALNDYANLSAEAKALLTAEEAALDVLAKIMDGKEAAVLFRPLEKSDLDSNHAFTWDFEEAGHAFKENVGTAVDGFGMETDPTNAGNKVLKVPSGATVYAPRRWNSSYGMISASWTFNTKDLQDESGDVFNEIVLWQSNTEPENYITWFWKQQSASEYFNDGTFVYKTGASRNQNWWAPQLRIGTFNGENKWFTLTAVYSENKIDLTLTSKDGTVNKTGSITVTDMGDLRQGRIGVKGSSKSGNTIYYDDISVKFDISAEEAASFASTHAEILAMNPTTFEAEYATAKAKLVAALDAYKELPENVQALLTTEKAALDDLEEKMEAIEEALLYAPLGKSDLTDDTFTWTFENTAHAFKENVGTAVDGFGITEYPESSGNHVLKVPDGSTVYTPRRWNNDYALVSATWEFDTTDLLRGLADKFNEIVLWQSNEDPNDYITWFWEQTDSQHFNDGRYVYKDGIGAMSWNEPGLRIGTFNGENKWFTLTAVYHETSIDLTLTSKDGTVNKTGSIKVTDMGDLRQGRIGVKGSHPDGNKTLHYDNISVRFDFSAENATAFASTYATLLDMSPAQFRADYTNQKDNLVAALAAYENLSDSAKALLTAEKGKLDALKEEMDAIIDEASYPPLEESDLDSNNTFTWTFEDATHAFKESGGDAVDGFGIVEDGSNYVLKVPGGQTVYTPRRWNRDYKLSSASWDINIAEATVEGDNAYNEIVVWKSGNNYVTFKWKKTSTMLMDTLYSVYVDGTAVGGNWLLDNMKVKTSTDTWFTLTAEYTKDGISVKVKSKSGDVETAVAKLSLTQLTEAGITDFRVGTIGVKGSQVWNNTGNTFYYDNISATFTALSVNDKGHTITMHNGAYLKTNGTIGIRFGADVTGETERKVIGWGVLVLPVEKLGEHELTLDWISLTTTPVGGVTAAHEYKSLESSADLPGQLYGSIVEITGGAYPAMSLVARMYVKYEGDIVVYSDLSVSRSMYQTAMKGVNSYIADGILTGVTAFTAAQYDTTNKTDLTTYGKQALTILNDADIIEWTDTPAN